MKKGSFPFLFILMLACAGCASLLPVPQAPLPSVEVDPSTTEKLWPELSEPDFQWPVYEAVITQRFRPHRHPAYPRIHQGVDLAASQGTPIYAVDDGRVTYAGRGQKGYGRLVVITHRNQRYQSYYAHLSRYKVKRGDPVRRGDLVGLMGRSGRATGVHLHFEIRKDQVALNPLDQLPPLGGTTPPQANP